MQVVPGVGTPPGHTIDNCEKVQADQQLIVCFTENFLRGLSSKVASTVEKPSPDKLLMLNLHRMYQSGTERIGRPSHLPP